MGKQKQVRVYDCRGGGDISIPKSFDVAALDFNDFLRALHKEFSINCHDIFFLTDTDRKPLDFDRFAKLQNGNTLYILRHEAQALPAATEEEIKFQPHYDTLIQCGTYDYHASAGQQPLSYVLAELIDNSLAATAKNKDVRTIELLMMFDETLGKPAVIVLDNGCGMTSQQLNNWAVYRHSKFIKKDSKYASEPGYVRPDPVPRSLNSDISYFGVGGKQAVFHIGNSVRMISKSVSSLDVHELVVSEEEFKRREKQQEEIYGGVIKNRKPGDFSHVNKSEHLLQALIAEEPGKESFTAVVITGVLPKHIAVLKENFDVWTRQLAHVYHYYIHGVNGNDMKRSSTDSSDLPKIDIHITLREKPSKCPCVVNLREIDDDLQTLHINAAADTFEFQAETADGGKAEGVLRYFPFLYDKETYPRDPMCAPPDDEEDQDNESGVHHQARGKDAIFECYWNGRLIPYTTISEFDWCSEKSVSNPLKECHSRFSGVIFTDDKFLVTQNKLTFMELENKLKKQNTIFTCIVNGQKRRSNMRKEFNQWLLKCHEKYDKQVKFLKYLETITRTDAKTPKGRQHPWATFSTIEWDGKVYKKGQLVKSHKTQPTLYGSIVRFMLNKDCDGDVFATGGQVELVREPKALHDQTTVIPISKIDRTATDEAIKMNISADLARIPAKLNVEWPEGSPWQQNAVEPAGAGLGPLKVQIQNKKGESLSRMPTMRQTTVKKLTVVLKIVFHDPKGDEEIYSCVGQFNQSWGFWFNKFDKLTRLGRYTLFLNTVLIETNKTVFGDNPLPSFDLKFTIKEGCAESFSVGAVSPPVHVGVPFDIPLQIKDAYDHATAPPPDLKPVLECSGLELSYEAFNRSGPRFIMRGVKARGKVAGYQQSKTFDLKVILPGLKKASQSIKFSLLPGKPHSLHVTPQGLLRIENGNSVRFNVEVHDEAGNITAHPKQTVLCQVQSLPPVAVDCSNGTGQLVTQAINLKINKGEPEKIRVRLNMQGQKHIPVVVRDIMVSPSTQVKRLELCSHNDENLLMRNNENIEWLAGGLLENLFYRLYDEAGREVPLTNEIASKIKVNWTGDVKVEALSQGRLPNVQVPTQVKEERFCQVYYQDQSVSVSFKIVPRPDEPSRLKVTLPQNTVKMGEILPGSFHLELLDQYDNVTKALTSDCVKHITVEAEGLDKSAIKLTWQESSHSVAVRGVCFQSGSLGSKELCFTYRSYVERVIIRVTAGLPAYLKLLSEPEQPLQVLNDCDIPTPFIVQLCDKWGNPSTDQRVVVQLRSSPLDLKVMKSVTSQPVDTEGKATFTVKKVSGPKGRYKLLFKGSFNEKPIPGPEVNLSVFPDPSKPVALSLEFNTRAKCLAGGIFPVFSVSVMSEDRIPIHSFNPAAVSMLLWEGAPSENPAPVNVPELRCTSKDVKYHFRNKESPEKAGLYTIRFSLRTETLEIFSDPIAINVEANQPVRLAPESQPPTPVVSCVKDIASRTLLENTTLKIMDDYGNAAGQDLEGNVVVSIKSSNGDSNKSLPVFEDRTSRVQFRLSNGQAHIPLLAIMENSPGEHGCTYILLFKPEVPMAALDSFELPFHFYNDAENQKKTSELSKEKDKLTAEIASQENTFGMYRCLLEEQETQLVEATSKVTGLRTELSQRNVISAQDVSIPMIRTLVAQKTAEVDRILKSPRRVYSVRNCFDGQPDVVGMVGHLACVKDDDAARVISWHISGDMDVVITRTTEAAKRIYADTRGRQQVMPLDSVYMSPANRPLPHIRNGLPLFTAPGNPVFARQILIFTRDQRSCDIVFKNLLGDTILMDDLDSANDYRRRVIQNKISCPTILTKQGDRLSAKGKFGGAQNRAPPIDVLKVFGAPLPLNYHVLREQIELLSKYQSALENEVEAQTDRNKTLKEWNDKLPARQALEEKKKQLEEIKRRLASVSVTPMKRRPADAGQVSGIDAKRHRTAI